MLLGLLLVLLGCGSPPLPPRELGAEAAEALGDASLDSLREEEQRLLKRRENDPDPVAVDAAIATIRLAILDFEVAPDRRKQVEMWVASLPPEDPASRLVRAELALRDGDLATARRFLGPGAPTTDEERLLYARIALAGGEPGAALSWMNGVQELAALRVRLLRVRILHAAGRQEEGAQELRSILLDYPDHLLAQVLRVELGAPEVQVQLADLVQVRYRLPNRLRARVLGAQARALLARGDAAKAVSIAELSRAMDGTDPDALLVLAAAHARKGQLREGLADLGSASPAAADVLVARILLLLDLDRVEQADALLKEQERLQAQAALLPGLHYLVQAEGRGERPQEPTPPPLRPVLVWAAALASALALEPEAVDRLTDAMSAASSSSNPFENELVARIQMRRAILGGPEKGLIDAREAVIRWPEDPAMHLLLGSFYEASPKATSRALAAAHYNRACSLSPEYARAWYERGRFYQDAPDERTRDAWTRYLALDPSGPRAKRAAEFLASTAP
ncbi:MAG TPA: hypothetical protein PKY30_00115 [Myxococcota bacterium]|nr:hypothetical protein [Myxococcota bacterium]